MIPVWARNCSTTGEYAGIRWNWWDMPESVCALVGMNANISYRQTDWDRQSVWNSMLRFSQSHVPTHHDSCTSSGTHIRSADLVTWQGYNLMRLCLLFGICPGCQVRADLRCTEVGRTVPLTHSNYFLTGSGVYPWAADSSGNKALMDSVAFPHISNIQTAPHRFDISWII